MLTFDRFDIIGRYRHFDRSAKYFDIQAKRRIATASDDTAFNTIERPGNHLYKITDVGHDNGFELRRIAGGPRNLAQLVDHRSRLRHEDRPNEKIRLQHLQSLFRIELCEDIPREARKNAADLASLNSGYLLVCRHISEIPVILEKAHHLLFGARFNMKNIPVTLHFQANAKKPNMKKRTLSAARPTRRQQASTEELSNLLIPNSIAQN